MVRIGIVALLASVGCGNNFHVTSTSPGQDATAVGTSSAVTVTFDQTLSQVTITFAPDAGPLEHNVAPPFLRDGASGIIVAYQGWTVHPQNGFAPSTAYTATIAAMDQAGEALDGVQLHFRTGSAP